MANRRPWLTLPVRYSSSAVGLRLGFLLALSLSGCISHADVPAVPPVQSDTDATLPKTAILLFANETNTVDAPEILRNLMFDEAARHRFNLQPLADTESLLREQLKISDGGQLTAVTPQEIGQALGVDQLFFGDVLEWQKITTGVYNTVTVKANFKLVESKTGTVVWERTHAAGQRRINANVGDIVAGALGNLLLNPMTPYAKQLMREIGRQLPN
jgi:hypothetical protein